MKEKVVKWAVKCIYISLILFFVPTVAAATIFSDDFESGTLSGWILTSAAGANNWTNSLIDPFQGSRHANTQPQSTSEPASVMERTISTVGYTSIIFNYTKKLGGLDSADEFQVEWFDGTSWIILEQTGSDSVDDTSYASRQFSLPASAENNANLKIKFECTAGAVSETCKVDNILLIGTNDTTSPMVTVNTPLANQFINTSSVSFNITLNENGTARYTLNNGITNITMSSIDNQNFNATNTSIADGSYNVQFYTNDSAGNKNSTVTRAFTIDTIAPLMSITLPQNVSYNALQMQLNYTASDTNLQACWYSLNNGQTNTSVTCGTNATSLAASQGSNTWAIYVNDSAGNKNSSAITFFIDSINPSISFTTGTSANGTTIPYNDIFINVSVTETNEANSTFSLHNSTSLVNITTFIIAQRTINFTNLPDGKYFYNVIIKDTLNNQNTTETRTITIDTIQPSITIVSPLNTTYANATILINITSNGDFIWFYNGTANETYASAVYRTFAQNSTTIIAYANDSVGNINTTSIAFFVDSISPTLSITSPQEGSTFGTNTSLQLNFSVADTNLQACFYHIDSANNITIPNCVNTFFNTSSGSHTLYLYANDTLENKAVQTVNFTITLGAPSITLRSPANNLFHNASSIKFNYTATDPDLNACELWGNFTGTFVKNQSNATIVSAQESIFNLSLSDGSYLWNIQCNDTLGNQATAGNRTFRIDTLSPSVTLSQPTGTKTSRNNIPLEFTATDTNLNTCWYNVYRGTNNEIPNTTISCSSSSAFNVTLDATFTLTLYANDSAGNNNASTISFTVDTTPPSSSDGGSSGGGSSGGGSGGGTPITTLAPKILEPNPENQLKITLNAPQNTIIKRGTKENIDIEVTNNENAFLNNCKLQVKGYMVAWFLANQNKGLSAGERFRFNAEISIPEHTEPGSYTSDLVMQCDEGRQTSAVQITVFRNSFEAAIKNYERTVDTLRIFYTLAEFAEEDHEIILEYALLNLEGELVVADKQTITLASKYQGEQTLEFKLPKGTSGEYDLTLTLTDGKTSNELTQRILLPSRSILGLAITENNKRVLYVAGIFAVVTLILFFIGKFAYNAYAKIKVRRFKSVEEKHGRKLIKIDVKRQ